MTEPFKPPVNWEIVEQEYKLGVLPVDSICEIHGISRSTLERKIREGGWTRNLIGQVRAAAQEELLRDDARKSKLNDAVAAAGETIANVVRTHRADIARMRAMSTQIMDALASRMNGEPPDEQNQAILGKDPAHVTLHRLTDTYGRLVSLERQAYNIDDPNAAVTADAIRIQTEAARRELIRRGVSIGDIDRGLAGASALRPGTGTDQGPPPGD